MNWYYADGGQQRGPVTEAEFKALVTAGARGPQTLVWHEVLAHWAASIGNPCVIQKRR